MSDSKALEAAIRVTAAGAGGYLGTVVGPEAGAAAGEVLAETGVAAIEWWGRTVRERVGRTLVEASESADQQIAEGHAFRDDLTAGEAASLKEAVVDAAARSAERRKCKVISNLYVAIAFDPSISVNDALLYVRRIRDSSWRQLVAIQYLLAGDRTDERARIAKEDEERIQGGGQEIAPAISAEFSELAQTLELVGVGQPGGRVSNPSHIFGGGQITSQSVAGMTATELGREVARLGSLEEVVEENELDDLAGSLSSPFTSA